MWSQLLGWLINDCIGTNVHVILEQYKPATGLNREDQRNPILDAAEGKNKNGIAATEVRGFSESGRRRIFVFSANDKVALKAQMRDIGTLLY